MVQFYISECIALTTVVFTIKTTFETLMIASCRSINMDKMLLDLFLLTLMQSIPCLRITNFTLSATSRKIEVNGLYQYKQMCLNENFPHLCPSKLTVPQQLCFLWVKEIYSLFFIGVPDQFGLSFREMNPLKKVKMTFYFKLRLETMTFYTPNHAFFNR